MVDLNGDDQDDLLAGHFYRGDAGHGGHFHVHLGPIAEARLLCFGDVDVITEQAEDAVGFVVDAGDLNDDGAQDLIAIDRVHRSVALSEAGVFTGPLASREMSLDDAETIVRDLNGPFDLNTQGGLAGNGGVDLAIGEAHDADLASRALVFQVPLPAVVLAPGDAAVSAYSSKRLLQAGYTVAPSGDLDGDGYGDLAVGALLSQDGNVGPGRAWVVYGPLRASGELQVLASATIEGEVNCDLVGERARTRDDLDGDGLGEFGVSARGHGTWTHGEGAVCYFADAPPLDTPNLTWDADHCWTAVATKDSFGHDFATVDLERNARPDLALGDSNERNQGILGGAVFLFYDPLGGG